MSTLDSLIRLHRWQLDEHRRRVADFEQLIAQLRGEMERLDAEEASEQAAAARSREAAYAYGSYAGSVIERRRKLAQSLAATEAEAVKAREALAGVFQEVKRYEIAAAKRLLEQRALADRLQQNTMDELGIEIHRRRSIS